MSCVFFDDKQISLTSIVRKIRQINKKRKVGPAEI